MANRFETLRIDTRNILPQPWYDYPVLKLGQFDNIEIYRKDKDFIIVCVGLQDNRWVAGRNVNIVGCCGGGCLPGRKWGEFASREDAILYSLGAIYDGLTAKVQSSSPLLSKLTQAIQEIQFHKRQLTLF